MAKKKINAFVATAWNLSPVTTRTTQKKTDAAISPFQKATAQGA
jgi:hypothetical protein